MRLGIFGGTFDPIHLGHLLLAESCREQARLDRVIFLPTAVPPHKQDRMLTPGTTRAEMIELAIAGNESFAVSRYEVDRGGVNYTVDTLSHFRAEFPEAELFFLMGADMLHDLPTWHDPAGLCRLATPIVVPRPGSVELRLECLAGLLSPAAIEQVRGNVVQMPEIDISATGIRRRLAESRSIRYQTPRAVEAYIEMHGLYRR